MRSVFARLCVAGGTHGDQLAAIGVNEERLAEGARAIATNYCHLLDVEVEIVQIL